MRKFLIVCGCLLALYLTGSFLYYQMGVYIDWDGERPVTTFVRNEGQQILLERNGTYEPFEIRGVDLGSGKPGHFATEYAISKQDYLRWFRMIQDMGANSIRVYTILHDDFYNALYEYNKGNDNPLYLIHGLWVNDYVQNSHRDAYDSEMLDVIVEDSRTLVDVLHGERKLSLGRGLGSGTYNKDVSPWVIGYILGVEWEDVTVAYTDNLQKEKNSYQGEYMYTTPDASPFEAFLAQIGDRMIAYESQRYGRQRLVAFSNWPTTDPFDYPKGITEHFIKIAKVDVEHIRTTQAFVSGVFASYHIYPYYPDYLQYDKDAVILTDSRGQRNTYLTYLKKINDHHTIPVIISEFGVPTSRGMAQRDFNTSRNQGGMSETDQGRALTECYQDIMDAGCAGSVIFTWQDEWFKRTWNTMHAVDLLKTAFWSDYQTNEQYFGILSFDPGKDRSICYVDGDRSDWTEKSLLTEREGLRLSAKYDEKFIYLLVEGEAVSESRKLYIPVDVTPKTGAERCARYDLRFGRPVDFVIALNGKTDSRVVVQERYDVMRAMFSHETDKLDPYEFPPAPDTDVFNPINMILQTSSLMSAENIGVYDSTRPIAEVFETGLLTYGNANPKAPDYNSLADFCYGDGFVEIKLPWQLLNFSNPSEMTVHDDYYLHYGVENIRVGEMYLGISTGEQPEDVIPLTSLKLRGWHNSPTYHERLKPSYYDVQKMWGGNQ